MKAKVWQGVAVPCEVLAPVKSRWHEGQLGRKERVGGRPHGWPLVTWGGGRGTPPAHGSQLSTPRAQKAQKLHPKARQEPGCHMGPPLEQAEAMWATEEQPETKSWPL